MKRGDIGGFGIREDRTIKLRCFLGLLIEPQVWRNLCIVLIPLSASADIARIWESLDPFGPTVARLTQKYPSATETSSGHQGSPPRFPQTAIPLLQIRLP